MLKGAEALLALRQGRLAGVRRLDLSGLDLREVPREIFALAPTLEALDLAGNALTTLPDDFARLGALRILFCSGNPFDRLPPVLGDCQALSQIGFRKCRLRELPGESLPPNLRWLTLTDNRLEILPAALGQRPALQKLMLAGNRLDALPPRLADAGNLELLRIAANGFETVPGWLLEMPRLAWLAFAGNPLDAAAHPPPSIEVEWSALEVGSLLGEGASGLVYGATWRGRPEPVALKLYKGAMTSDGLPALEMATCLAAGTHRNVVGGLGHVTGHPGGREGLLMPLLPDDWRVLAGPPNATTCSRDVYPPGLRFDAAVALRLARGMAAATAHLHGRGLLHGDLYAHNILWDGAAGDAVLSDFGAASFMPDADARSLARLDVLAFGILLGELLERSEDDPALAPVRALQAACSRPAPAERPSMAEALDVLEGR